MSVLDAALTTPFAQSVVWALLHFLWQGAAIALVAFALLRFSGWRAPARYATGIAALALMLASPVVTVLMTMNRSTDAATVSPAPPPVTELRDVTAAAAAPVAPVSARAGDALSSSETEPVMDRAVVRMAVLGIWLSGVLVLSGRLLGGWLVVGRLARRHDRPVTPEVQALARRVAGRLALDRFVRLFESSAVAVPVTVGWIKPVVLLPAAAMSGLSMAQVEALLAHELAHVRRHDYLVNLLQSAVETLLFYHPAVWWVSRQVRVEREHCCDDLAVDVCDRLVYATALTDLAAIATPRLALAATDGSLLARVRRILGESNHDTQVGSGWMPALVVAAMLGVIAPVALADDDQTLQPNAGAEAQVAADEARPQQALTWSELMARERARQLLDGRAHLNLSPETLGKYVLSTQGTAGADHAMPPAGQGSAQAAEQRRREEEALKAQAAGEARARLRQAEMEALARELEAKRTELAKERLQIEERMQRAQMEARIDELNSELNVLRDHLVRVKQLVERGQASVDTVNEIEAKIASAQRQIGLEKVTLDMHRLALDVKLRELMLEREALGARAAHEARAAVAAEAGRPHEEAEAVKRLESERPLLAASATVRAGDLLVIVIASEPDLPRLYTVRPDGTIRMLFLGPIRVAGQTAAQVRDSLGRLLTERKLGSGAEVRVAVRR
jgi:beta-lactamase regulating signal transducer with metallopeptidase domain